MIYLAQTTHACEMTAFQIAHQASTKIYQRLIKQFQTKLTRWNWIAPRRTRQHRTGPSSIQRYKHSYRFLTHYLGHCSIYPAVVLQSDVTDGSPEANSDASRQRPVTNDRAAPTETAPGRSAMEMSRGSPPSQSPARYNHTFPELWCGHCRVQDL